MQGNSNFAEEAQSVDQSDLMQDEDFAEYNKIYSASVIFRKNFKLEAQKYMLALNNSFDDVRARLPEEILKMPAKTFADLCQNDPEFNKKYNIEFRVVENPMIGVLDSISKLF